MQQYPKLSLHWTADQYHNKLNMDTGEPPPPTHSLILPCKSSSCSTTNTSQKRLLQARIVIPSHGHCRARGALTLLVEQLGAQGCTTNSDISHVQAQSLGRIEEADCCRKTNSLCCKCPVPGFLCKPEENPGKSAGLAPA